MSLTFKHYDGPKSDEIHEHVSVHDDVREKKKKVFVLSLLLLSGSVEEESVLSIELMKMIMINGESCYLNTPGLLVEYEYFKHSTK